MKILAERGGWLPPACFARAGRCHSSVSKHLLRHQLVSAYLLTGRKNAYGMLCRRHGYASGICGLP